MSASLPPFSLLLLASNGTHWKKLTTLSRPRSDRGFPLTPRLVLTASPTGPNGASLQVAFLLKNTGNSPAIVVRVEPKITLDVKINDGINELESNVFLYPQRTTKSHDGWIYYFPERPPHRRLELFLCRQADAR
jgi:hypothetical protein